MRLTHRMYSWSLIPTIGWIYSWSFDTYGYMRAASCNLHCLRYGLDEIIDVRISYHVCGMIVSVIYSEYVV